MNKAQTTKRKKVLTEEEILHRDILRTIAEVEGYDTRKRRKSNPFAQEFKPPTLAPKTYKQYIQEAKSPEYFIEKYNKKH